MGASCPHRATTRRVRKRIALIVARMTDKRMGLDTATQMLDRQDE
jgi:hypothetical protein